MIDILKKRHKVGDTVTLHTSNASFTGVIDAFEHTCVILTTEDGDEFIANDIIKRISVPKTTNKVPEKVEIKQEQEEVKPITKEEVKTEKIEETLPKTEYKVGDKIPIEELEKRIDKKNKTKFPKAKEKGIRFTSLSDLRQIILPEIETENKKIVSANGTITKYFGDRKFGFISDKFGYEIWSCWSCWWLHGRFFMC